MKKLNPFFAMIAVSLFIITGHANAFELKKFENNNYLTVNQNCENRSGCRLSLSPRTGTRQQAFFWGNKFYNLNSYGNIAEIRTATGKCLEVQTRCAGQDGCPVQIWNCNGRPEQAWYGYLYGNGDILYNYVNKKYLEARCANSNPSSCVIQVWSNNNHQRQKWDFID